MLTVAIAGGTGHLGLAFVELLIQNPKYRVVILSRKAPDSEGRAPAPVAQVDYADIEATARLLESNAVHTIVSALDLKTAEGSAAESNLVAASAKSGTTRRFMASDWAVPISPDPALHTPQNTHRLKTTSSLSKTDLEWTCLHVGQIADYLGTPHLPSHMGVYALQVDMPHATAAIPGSGDDLISFTYSRDIARFVEAALGLERWEREMWCYGDVRSLGEVVGLAEGVRGVKFTVTHDSVEMLEQGKMTELPSHRKLYPIVGKEALQKRISTFGLYTVKGLLHLPKEGSLNSLFLHIKTMTVPEIVGFWKGK
ncbi:hypothetical protein GE09DRAFT_1042248 [Coniochaeta sp. 2T2.1]|nr:hypothetical protein GE09DRAFT_1042248 [Coniochaeta sp. 2T2.1]